VLNARKQWVSFGQIANVCLVFGRIGTRPAAVLVDRDTPCGAVHPIAGRLGTRASMVATVEFHDCVLPADALVGPPGFGISAVAAGALDLGRYSVAWGCVGIAEACLAASIRYAAERHQFGCALQEHQLVQRRITDIACHVRASRLLCIEAGRARHAGAASALLDTCVAKYYAAEACNRAAAHAVQIHGAVGCSGDAGVQRLFRDAKVMQIIEGSTEIQEMLIATMLFQEAQEATPGCGGGRAGDDVPAGSAAAGECLA